MSVRSIAAAGMFFALFGLCALPASGQITSYVDEQGRRVYVNADPPASRRHTGRGKSNSRGSARTTNPQRGASRNSASPAQAPNERLERMVRETAERHKMDPALVRAVISAESGWNPRAVSSKGALGLMQLIPGTAQRFGAENAFDPRQNVDAGVRYLRTLLERYDGDLFKTLAAYNAGESAVDRAGGVPNYRETRQYVRKVTDSYFQSGSVRAPRPWGSSHPIYRVVDDQGRVVFTNE